MRFRQAKKIIKNQIIRCRSRYDGPEDIITGGCTEYPEEVYRQALITLQRKMNREAAKPSKGSIERCTAYYREQNRVRLALHIARLAA